MIFGAIVTVVAAVITVLTWFDTKRVNKVTTALLGKINDRLAGIESDLKPIIAKTYKELNPDATQEQVENSAEAITQTVIQTYRGVHGPGPAIFNMPTWSGGAGIDDSKG